MSPLRQVFLVAVRDFRERLASRAFQISTGLTVVLVGAFILLPSIIGGDDATTWTIGTTGSDGAETVALVRNLSVGSGATIEGRPVSGVAEAEGLLRSGDIDIAVVDRTIISGDDTPNLLLTATNAAVASLEFADRAVALGLDEEDVASLFGTSATSPTLTQLPAEADETDDNRILAFFAVIFLFISIVTYGQWILIGVIEEKSSRVVEVVLGAVKPYRLLAGKILGIGTLAMGQLILIGVVSIALLNWSSSFDIPSAAATTAVSVIVWFLLGFGFYATAYAAAGSLVSRQEDAQNAAFPLTILLMASYFVATFSLGGDNQILRITSLFPPTAPMTMPLRMAAGDAAAWEIALSLTLMVFTTYLLIRLAGRIYAGGLLGAGSRVRLRDAWKGAEA